MNTNRKTQGNSTRAWTAVPLLIAILAVVCGSGCASVNRNATAVILGGVLGTAGGVAGFAATRGNSGGATAGAAAGAAVGAAIGHQVDKLVWRKEAERTHEPCPYCGRPVNIEHVKPGVTVFCPSCGGSTIGTNKGDTQP